MFLTPSAQSNLFSELIFEYAFSMLKSTKFPPPYGGGFTIDYTSHVMKRLIQNVDGVWPLNGFKNGSNLAENRIRYVLLTSRDGNSIFSSMNRLGPVRKSYR